MKKILAILSSITLCSFAVTSVVACGNKVDTSGNIDYEKDENFYELFGKRFTSKEDAINYFLSDESGVQTETQKEFITSLSLNEEKFSNPDQMFDYIKSNFPIEKITTNKNVDKYVMDGMNQLSANVVSDPNEEVWVYRDSFGNAVYEQNEQTAIEEVENSYLKDIEENYYLDNKIYKTKDEVLAAYMNKFNNSESAIVEQDLYTFNGLAYAEKELDKVIEKTIVSEYSYNGRTFLDSEINMPNVIDPTYEDKAKIKKYTKSPGKYLVEARSTADGTYTGDLIINSETDISEIIYDETKWVKGEETSENVFEVIQSTVVSAVVMSAAPIVQKLEAIIYDNYNPDGAKYCFDKNNNFDLSSLVGCYTDQENYQKLDNLLKKYEVLAESEYSIKNLNNIESLETTEKAAIYLYQMREAFRGTNITAVDNQIWNQIGYDILSNFLIGVHSWNELLEIIGVEDIFLILDYLVDKNAFFQVLDQFVQKDKIKDKLSDLANELEEKVGNDNLEKQINNVQKSAEFVAQVIGAELAVIGGMLDVALSQVPIIGDIIAFFKEFSFRQTVTYTLMIPGTENVLSYEMEKWFFEGWEFNPEEIFRVFEIKEPKDKETYLVDGRYFPTYDLAYEQLLENIVDLVVAQGPSAYFVQGQAHEKRKTKSEIVEFWKQNSLTNNKVESKYSDFFGGKFDSRDAAVNSMLGKLKDENNLDKFYSYRYGTNSDAVFISENLNEIKDFVKEKNPIQKKLVSVGELTSSIDFDNLYDLSEYRVDIYTFNIYGMDYFYKDLTNAYYGILNQLNFTNTLVESKVTTYTFNEQFFENQFDYVTYLNENIIVIKNEEKNLLMNGGEFNVY